MRANRCFIGSSGVGKSTLVNALLGQQEQSTGYIRETTAKDAIQRPRARFTYYLRAGF